MCINIMWGTKSLYYVLSQHCYSSADMAIATINNNAAYFINFYR